MATGDIYPNGDNGTNQWTAIGCTLHHDCIDEDKGSPSMSDNIGAIQPGGQDNFVEDFDMGSITITEATSVTVYAYGYGGATYGGDAEVDFYDGNSWQGYQNLGLPIGVTPEWRNKTFGSLSMNQTALDNCRVRFRADIGASKQSVVIGAVYAVVTFSSGWSHKFNGVANSDIAKINGVSISDIAKVQGV